MRLRWEGFADEVNHGRGGVGPIADEYELLGKVVHWVEKSGSLGMVMIRGLCQMVCSAEAIAPKGDQLLGRR
jgi:hypothetical protein